MYPAIVPFIVTATLWGCAPDLEPKDADPGPEVDPTDGASTTDTDLEGPATDTATTTTTTTTPPTTTTTTTPALPTTQPIVPCPYPPDPAAIADCAAGAHAAMVDGVGYPAIQTAVDAAGEGDTVVVCPGTWPGELTVSGRSLVAADPTPGATVVDGVDTTWLIDLTSGTVRGLTFRRGTGYLPGAIRTIGDVVLECVVADDNWTANGYADGGAILAKGGTLVVRYSAFGRNRASYAGGAIFGENVVVEDTVFVDNRAFLGGAIGAGTLTVLRSSFTTNEAVANGGALWAEAGPTTVEDSTFVENYASGGGGAIHLEVLLVPDLPPSPFTVTGSVFEANTSDGPGGAVLVFTGLDTPISISDTEFTGNLALESAGALVVSAEASLDVSVVDSTFSVNEGGEAGAISIEAKVPTVAAGTVSLVRSVFEDNLSAGRAGTLLVNVDMEVEVTGSDLTVLRNSSTDGAVVLIDSAHTLDCTTCDFGAGADDNVPVDATKEGVETQSLPESFTL